MILPLSRRVQRQAHGQIVRLSVTNALGYGNITGHVMFLIALYYGASDLQMGLLYAAPFTTTLAALFVPLLLNGRETTSIWSRFWLLRTMIALGYLAVPWLGPGAARIWLFVLIYYTFMTLRAFGMSGYFTVMRALAPPRENAGLMAKAHMAGQIAVLATQCLAFVVLTVNLLGAEERNLFFLISIGILFNGITSWLISRLPRTGYLEDGSLRNLVKAARRIRAVAAYRETALVTASQAALAVFGGYVISYMRNVAGFSSGAIFGFTVVGFVCAIFITNLLRLIGSRIGPRVMLLASHAVMAVMGCVWALLTWLPAADHRALMAGLYGLTVSCLTVSTTVGLQLRTGRLPVRHSVDYSIVYDLCQVTGAVLAIVAARLSMLPAGGAGAIGLHVYSLTFVLWALTALAVCRLALKMRPRTEAGLRRELTMLLPSSMFTIIRAHRLDQDDNIVRRHLALEGLLQTPNPISRDLMLEHLQSPDTGVRRSCIRVLMGYPLDAAVPTLLAEAASPLSPLRADAITALGFTARRDLIPNLRGIWDDAPAEIRAVLIKTLLRLRADVSDVEIRLVWQHCPVVARMDILIGLALTDRTVLLLELLGDALSGQPDSYGSRPLLGYVAAAAGRQASLYDIFTEEDQHPGQGIAYIAANHEGAWPDGLDAAQCGTWIAQDDYAALEAALRRVINADWVRVYDRTTALGVLFLVLLVYTGALGEGIRTI